MSKGITTDPSDPRLKIVEPNGMNEAYLVLPEEERSKGYVRPFRNKYTHVGERPTYPIKPLSKADLEKYSQWGYTHFEKYPKDYPGAGSGRYWTEKTLNSGCGVETVMGDALSATYARDPKFYGATYCVGCKKHFPVIEFTWSADGERVGS